MAFDPICHHELTTPCPRPEQTRAPRGNKAARGNNTYPNAGVRRTSVKRSARLVRRAPRYKWNECSISQRDSTLVTRDPRAEQRSHPR